MSLVFSWFLEKWIFQILLVSFSVTFDTMRGNMVLLQGVPKDLYTYAASRVIVDVFQSHIESLQLLLKSLSATLVLRICTIPGGKLRHQETHVSWQNFLVEMDPQS